jgi:hypothetical protein
MPTASTIIAALKALACLASFAAIFGAVCVATLIT